MKRLRLQTGANLVEFALVSPLLLVLVFGIADMGLALFNKAVITNASREGARAGMVFRSPARVPDQEIIDVVNSYCSNYLVTFGTSTPGVDIDRAGPGGGTTSGDTLTVTVNFTYDYVVLSRLIPTLTSLGMVGTTVMRME